MELVYFHHGGGAVPLGRVVASLVLYTDVVADL